MKKVLVTGGTRGIGLAIAMKLHEQGHKVYVNALTDKHNTNANGMTVINCDVSDLNACKEMIDKIHSDGETIDILVNSAGITRDAFFVKQTYDTWDKVIKTNLYSVFNTCHLLIPHMKTKKFGRIINISSINAHGMIGQTNYSASKAGVEGFSKSLAQEVGKDNVTVNCIAPGYTQTDMLKTVPEIILKQVIDKTPMKRLGTVHDIAEAVLFLINAPFITGTVLDVNGGLRT